MFPNERGKRLTEEQKNYKLGYEYLIKLVEYEEKERICGENRNSYFKTDHDATAMVLKKDYYSKLKGDELNEAEVNVLGNKQNLEKLVLSCEEKLNDKSIIESERELLQNTIEDTKYQINTQNEIINLIQSLKVKERNKNAK